MTYDPNWYAKSVAKNGNRKSTSDTGSPLFFVEFDASTIEFYGIDQYAAVRMCVGDKGACGVYHFNHTYTYISNGAHIDMVQDGIKTVHYVETFEKLRTINPKHHLLPENKETK